MKKLETPENNVTERVQDKLRAEKWLRQLFLECASYYERKQHFKLISKETGVNINEIMRMHNKIQESLLKRIIFKEA
ncbi:MAG: hypothetical protein ABIM99_04595 [Candidatus Dojkabacteria bacterium]